MASRQGRSLLLQWLTIFAFCAIADEHLDITMNLLKCDNELCREGGGVTQSNLSLGASVDDLEALGEEMVAAYPHHQIMPECAGVWNILKRKVCVKQAFFNTVRYARFDVCSWSGHNYTRSAEDSRRRLMPTSTQLAGKVESRITSAYYFSHYHGDAQAFCQWRWILGDLWKQRHGTPMAVLEIAAADYEGSAASWFLDRFLVAPGGRYVCIVDPSTSRGGRMTDDRRRIFERNMHVAAKRAATRPPIEWQLEHPGLEPPPMEPYTRRAQMIFDVPRVTDALMRVRSSSASSAPMADDGDSLFHVIRIETCPATLEEATQELDLAWGLLQDGGVIIWNAVLDRHNSLTVALESFRTFVKSHRAELEVIWTGFNHVIRKRPGGFVSSTSSLDWLLGDDAVISRRSTGYHPPSAESSSPNSCNGNDNVIISRAIDEWAIAPWGRSADIELGDADTIAPTDEISIFVSYDFFQSWEYEPNEIVGDFSFQSCPFVRFDAFRNNESKYTFLHKCPETCQNLILARSLASDGQGREALEKFTHAIESFGSRCSLTSRELQASVLAIRFARATVLQLMPSCNRLYEAAEEYAAVAEGLAEPAVRGFFGAYDVFMIRVALASALLRMNHNGRALASLKAAWSKVGAVFPSLTMNSMQRPLQPRLKSLDAHALLLLAIAARSAGDGCLFDTSMKGLHAKAYAWGEAHALKTLFTWERGAGKLRAGEDPAKALLTYFGMVDRHAAEAMRHRPSFSYTRYMPVISLLRAYIQEGMEQSNKASGQRSSAEQGGRVVLLAFYTLGEPYDFGLNLTEAARRFEAITRPFPENGGGEASWLRKAMGYADEVVIWSTKDFADDPTFADLNKAWPDHDESCVEDDENNLGDSTMSCHEGAIKRPSIYTQYKFNCPKHRIGFFGWKARVLQRAYQELLRPLSVTDIIGDGSPDILVYTDIDIIKYPLQSLGLAHGLRPRARAILQAAGGRGGDAGHSGWAPIWQSPCSDGHPTKTRLSEHVKRLTVEKIARAKNTPCHPSGEEGDRFSDLRCYGDWILPCANRLVLTRSPHVEQLLSDWIDACLDPALITHVPLTDVDEDTTEGEQARLFDGRSDGRELWAANLRSHTAEQAVLAVLVRAMVLRGELPAQWPRAWVPQGRTLVGPTTNMSKGPLPVFCMDQRVPCGDTRIVGEGENVFSLYNTQRSGALE